MCVEICTFVQVHACDSASSSRLLAHLVYKGGGSRSGELDSEGCGYDGESLQEMTSVKSAQLSPRG